MNYHLILHYYMIVIKIVGKLPKSMLAAMEIMTYIVYTIYLQLVKNEGCVYTF